MYSKNDYRYYLEHRLAMSDDYLAHYGVLGMKWGVRKDAYVRKFDRMQSNEAKIASYKTKLNTVGAKKRAEKAAKYKSKQDKYDKKAAKARARLAAGKKISTGQLKKIQKAEKYRSKVAKNSAKNDKYEAKIARLERKNTKLSKQIGKMTKQDVKYRARELKKIDKAESKQIAMSEKKVQKYSEKGNTKAAQAYKANIKNVKNAASLERKALNSMTVNELRSERNHARAVNIATSVGVSAASVPIAAAMGAPAIIMATNMPGETYKTKNRQNKVNGS